MTISEIKSLVKTDNSYDFLRTNPKLGDNIILLGLGGSYAYGTNTDTSDIDIRGITLNSAEDLLTNDDFEQVIDNNTDTTIYAFNKIINLLSNANPNTIELLGLKKEHYLKISNIGQELLNNADMFLSQKCIHSFGGYAIAQLRRLENLSNIFVGQEQREKHIYDTIINASETFKEAYFETPEDAIKLYIDKSQQEDYDTEIFMDVTLKHYPLRDYCGMWNEMKAIVTSYNKIGKRNANAIEHKKLGKHMMHLLRLYMMCLDILKEQKIITYREKEHALLMDIRNGKYLDINDQPVKEFYEIVDEYEKELEYAKKNTSLPEKPDYKRIKEFMMNVNKKVVLKPNKGIDT